MLGGVLGWSGIGLSVGRCLDTSRVKDGKLVLRLSVVLCETLLFNTICCRMHRVHKAELVLVVLLPLDDVVPVRLRRLILVR